MRKPGFCKPLVAEIGEASFLEFFCCRKDWSREELLCIDMTVHIYRVHKLVVQYVFFQINVASRVTFWRYTFLKKPFPEALPKVPHSPPLPITVPAASFPGPSAGTCSADLVCSFSMCLNYNIGATVWGLYPVINSFQTLVWCLIPTVKRKWMFIDTCTRSFTLASQTKLSMCQGRGTGFHPITIQKKWVDLTTIT